MFCVMCAIDIFKNKIMKSKFCVKKCQENVLLFMFLYIIRTPLLELKSVGKKCGLYTGKDGIHNCHFWYMIIWLAKNLNITVKGLIMLADYLFTSLTMVI